MIPRRTAGPGRVGPVPPEPVPRPSDRWTDALPPPRLTVPTIRPAVGAGWAGRARDGPGPGRRGSRGPGRSGSVGPAIIRYVPFPHPVPFRAPVPLPRPHETVLLLAAWPKSEREDLERDDDKAIGKIVARIEKLLEEGKIR